MKESFAKLAEDLLLKKKWYEREYEGVYKKYRQVLEQDSQW